jgi:SRSO17 transposase
VCFIAKEVYPMKVNFNIDDWLTDLNVFRECFYERSFELFVRYQTGLLLSNNKTVDGLNSQFIQKTDQSNVNRFLTDYPWLKDDFRDELKTLFMTNKIVKSFSFFVLDDTLLEKVGKSIESAGYHFDHTKNKCVFGHQIVTSGYIFDSEFYPFLLELYTKQEDCKTEKIEFKTKVEIALEILKKAIEFHKPAIVLIDSWYCTQEIFNFLDANGIQYIISSKSNRIFHYRSKKQKISIFTKTIRKTTRVLKDGYEYYVKSISAYFEDFGTKRLVFVKRRKQGERFFDDWNSLITNIEDVSDETIINFYANRFSIDHFHKEAKQNLGLGKAQLRKRRGVVRHLHLVAVAYTLLKCAKWLKKKWKEFSIAEKIRQMKEYFEKNTLIKTLKENKKDVLGAVNQLFADNRKS